MCVDVGIHAKETRHFLTKISLRKYGKKRFQYKTQKKDIKKYI